MGAKKKGGGGGGKQGEEEEDTSTRDLLYIYRKQSANFEATVSKTLESKFQECFENEEDLKEILVTEKIMWNGARALADAMKYVKYIEVYKKVKEKDLSIVRRLGCGMRILEMKE